MENGEEITLGKREREEDSVTLEEIIENEFLLEEEAKEVQLENWGKESICTFDSGYISQNIYACATCQKMNGNKETIGVCYGCSLRCHLEHDLYELYTKRDFRCDCGTKQCGSCELLEKPNDTVNDRNKYNHNFQGLYCLCDKVYDPSVDEMMQCYICQDWFDKECLEQAECYSKLAKTEEKQQFTPELEGDLENIFDCIICYKCAGNFRFLFKYQENQLFGEALLPHRDANFQQKEIKPDTDLTTMCKLDKIVEISDAIVYNIFFTKGWRDDLCKCGSCLEMYNNLNVLYLIEEKDQENDEEEVEEEIKTSDPVNLMESAMKQFESLMPNVSQRLDLLYEYEDMCKSFREFLAPLAQSNTVITTEHIKQFFAQLQNKKKRKLT